MNDFYYVLIIMEINLATVKVPPMPVITSYSINHKIVGETKQN